MAGTPILGAVDGGMVVGAEGGRLTIEPELGEGRTVIDFAGATVEMSPEGPNRFALHPS